MKIAGIELTAEQVESIVAAKKSGKRRITVKPTPEQSLAWKASAERERAGELATLATDIAKRKGQHSGFAQTIGQRRQELGVSLADLSEQTGMTRAALSRIENGLNVNPTVETLRRIGEALGLRLIVDFAA